MTKTNIFIFVFFFLFPQGAAVSPQINFQAGGDDCGRKEIDGKTEKIL